MGLFGLFEQSDADKRASEIRTGTAVPTRAERQRCWEARDGYFACLDKSGIIDAVKDEKKAAKACGTESAQFERDCATQWVGSLLLFSAVAEGAHLMLSCLWRRNREIVY